MKNDLLLDLETKTILDLKMKMKNRFGFEPNLPFQNEMEMKMNFKVEMKVNSQKNVEMNSIRVKLSNTAKKKLTDNLKKHHHNGELQLPPIGGITITLDEKLPPKAMKEECYITPESKIQVLGVRVGKELYGELKERFIKKERLNYDMDLHS